MTVWKLVPHLLIHPVLVAFVAWAIVVVAVVVQLMMMMHLENAVVQLSHSAQVCKKKTAKYVEMMFFHEPPSCAVRDAKM
eukprot:10623998-Prorocentrum_lima.AAC.1